MPTPGPLELVIILVIALIIIGPGKLPDVGASLGKSIREFRKASSDVQESVAVKVDTSPLPPTPVAAVTQAPVLATAAAVEAAPDSTARIAELERQLAETRAQAQAQETGTPVAAGAASGDSGSEASS
jgi:sec-independent protein translocase protein TatA